MYTSNVKKQISWKGLKIVLYNISFPDSIPYNSISNIRALDEHGKVLWEAEAPKTHHDSYYDMQLDTDQNLLRATSGLSYQYLIRLDDGKIVNYYLVK